MSTTFSCEEAPKRKVRDDLYHDLKSRADNGDEYALEEIEHYYKFTPVHERGWELESEWPEVSIAHGNDKEILGFLELNPDHSEIKSKDLDKHIKKIMIYLNTRGAKLPRREAIKSQPGQMIVHDFGMDNKRARDYLSRLLKLFTLCRKHGKDVTYA